ncbi:MAG: class I SAM-dependent methyltransferase [Gemmatimonadales bacterium]|jgi:SAM-dependent methyltransferase
MTRPNAPADTSDAHADLRRTLMRQFVTATDTVTLHDWPVELLRPRNSDDLISEADFVRDDRLPYWADLWPSSRILADYLLQTARAPDHGAAPARHRFQPGGMPPRPARRPPSLLELGCGLGLVTMAAMRAGYEVLATDYYEDALRFTRANAARALGREPETRHIDWRDFPVDLPGFDRIVAADVLYEKTYPPLLSAAIARVLAPGGEAIIADPGRIAAPDFLAGLATDSLEVVSKVTLPFDEGEIHQQITLYRIKAIPA